MDPENFIERVVGRLTNSDIELESEDFNRAFTVRCPDRKFASDVLHPRMMELLLQSPDAAFRFDRQWILDCEDGQVALEEIEPRAAADRHDRRPDPRGRVEGGAGR